MIKCKTCGKDITALYTFLKKNYCSSKCEKAKVEADAYQVEAKDLFSTLFK